MRTAPATVARMPRRKPEPDKRPPGRPARAGEPAETLSLRVTPAEREAWERAAGDADLTLAEWIRERCNRSIARSA